MYDTKGYVEIYLLRSYLIVARDLASALENLREGLQLTGILLLFVTDSVTARRRTDLAHSRSF